MSSMPETYEDTLPMVVAMNRDYDCGYVDGEGQPLSDCTDPIPAGATPPPQAYGTEDDLVDARITLPNFAHGTWTLTFPGEIRVWQQLPCEWAEVESGEPYFISSGGTVILAVEGLQPSSTPDNFIVLTCQHTDAQNNPLGLPVTDAVKVEVVAIDLEIDWISEYDEAAWAASMLINNDYDEGVTHPFSHEPISDNDRLHGQKISVPPWIVTDDDDLTAATLSIDGPDGQAGRYWIEVLGEPEYAQYVLVWTAEGELVPRHEENALPIELDADAVDLLIEGLAKYDNELNPIRLKAHFIPDEDYAAAGVFPDVTDEVMALVGVNCWDRDDWAGQRGQYTGHAYAGSYYDTLEQLAKNITGKAEDAFYLRMTNPAIEPIEPYTEVDISILLEILEERLRENVVEAALSEKAAGFGGNSYMALGEKAIRRVFEGGSPSGWKPRYDCIGMTAVIFARGVMMELYPGEYEALGFMPSSFWSKDLTKYYKYYGNNPPIALEDLLPGDYAYFENHPNYIIVHPKGAWSAEATIVITSGANGTYYGWDSEGGKTKSYDEWKNTLANKYNKGYYWWQWWKKITSDDVPGYQGDAGFIHVAKLAKAIFDYRTNHDE